MIVAFDTPRGPVRVGRGREQLEGVRRVQISEGLHRCRKELPQHPTQAQHVPGPVPDQALVAAGHQLDRLTQLGVPGDRAVMRPVQAHDLGQHMRIAGIRFRTGRRVPLPVTGHRHRVDREHLVPGRDQRLHPLPAVGLDPNLHSPGRIVSLKRTPLVGNELRDQRMQPSDSVQPFGYPSTGQPAALLIDDLHIVVILSPVAADEQHQ